MSGDTRNKDENESARKELGAEAKPVIKSIELNLCVLAPNIILTVEKEDPTSKIEADISVKTITSTPKGEKIHGFFVSIAMTQIRKDSKTHSDNDATDSDDNKNYIPLNLTYDCQLVSEFQTTDTVRLVSGAREAISLSIAQATNLISTQSSIDVLRLFEKALSNAKIEINITEVE